MTAKSVLLHPQGLRPRERAPTCLPLLLRHWCYLALLSTNNAQVSGFRLNFSWDLSQVCYFSNSSPIAFDFGGLKLRDLLKIMFFQTDYDEIDFKKSVIASFQWRHFITSLKNVTKLTTQDFSMWVPPNQNFQSKSWVECLPNQNFYK